MRDSQDGGGMNYGENCVLFDIFRIWHCRYSRLDFIGRRLSRHELDSYGSGHLKALRISPANARGRSWGTESLTESFCFKHSGFRNSCKLSLTPLETFRLYKTSRLHLRAP